ncbi:sensor histidine kinase [Bdellovibrio sp. HCB2-146]|uniref:sensor histidine kinase n=1 Tax=Bdellovibrio sp. HCB2-146 TaxID=3394362 RepID=UPI0039BD3A1C
MFSGEEYIRELIRVIAEELGIAYALVGHPEGPESTKIKTDYLWMHGRFVENISYDLAGTPCVNVICGTRVSCFVAGVAKMFPEDKMLTDLNIEAYIGAPTLKPNGELLGLVVLMDDKPLKNIEKFTFVAEFLATRVGAEYRRQEIEERLHKINNELERLAETRAQELTVALKRLLSQEKLATIGRITFGIAHELKNPLNIIINSAELVKELLEEKVRHEDLREPIDMIAKQGQRANDIITDMLRQARQDMGAVSEDVDLTHLIERTLTMCLTSLPDTEIRRRLKIERDIEPHVVTCLFDPPSMERVFINILDNSVYALNEKMKLSPEDFEPVIQVSLKTVGQKILIEFCDNGTGISSAHRDHVFEEFYTTKPAGDGTGLGLPIAKETVEKNNGTIRLESEYGHFTRIHIELPAQMSGRA